MFSLDEELLPVSCFISNAVGRRWLGADENIHTANVGNDPRGSRSLGDTHGPRGARLLITGTVVSYVISCHIKCHTFIISNVIYCHVLVVISHHNTF